MKEDKNKGSATVEATLVLPIFIFSVLVLFHSIRLRMAEAVLYEAATETVEYMAEVSYIEECNYLVPKVKLGEYIDNQGLVDSYIIGGVDGVSYEGSTYMDDEGYVCLCINYQVGIEVPLIGNLSGKRSYEIRQKAYKGDQKNEEEEQLSADEIYVYITDNREAYHTTRGCSHLDLSIKPTGTDKAKKNGYTACEFCGQDVGTSVLITNYGDKYHSRSDCMGLKRTVYRVKKSQVEGLGVCDRCGQY